MRTRHRIPTIFNIYMVDVLCCSLGCAILLWLINLHDAKQLGVKAGETRHLLSETQARLDLMTGRFQTAETDLARARSRSAELARLQTELEGTVADLEDRLAKKTKEQRAAAQEVQKQSKQAAELQVLVREQELLKRTADQRAADLADRLSVADARKNELSALAGTIPAMKDQLRRTQIKLEAATEEVALLRGEVEARVKSAASTAAGLRGLEDARRSLQRDLDLRTFQLTEANRALDLLKSDKKSLSEQISRARAAADHRFAGITLTGTNVVFLVDMSGSMDMVDEQNAAPDKWPGVRDTLVKIMRSLPRLERFQVILFSEKSTYLLGRENQWFDYDPVSGPEKVARALGEVKPKGNTNMYAAFEAAFRMRANGLDTIYLLSDGLPNVGEGLTPESARNLKETEKVEILGQMVRKTIRTTWNKEVTGQGRVRINAVGFFYESPDVGAFLWALARENDGSFVGMSRP